MKSILIKGLILFVALFYSGGVFAQTTFTITRNTVGTAATDELDDIIPQAITAANAGQQVTILFNVSAVSASGNTLVQMNKDMNASIYNVNAAGGSISFEKAPGATTEQGIEVIASGTFLGNPIDVMRILSCSSPVFFNGLKFTGPDRASGKVIIGLYIAGYSNVNIKNCVFDGLYQAIMVFDPGILSIQNNKFTNAAQNAIIIQENQGQTNKTNVNIIGNDINNASQGYSLMYAISPSAAILNTANYTSSFVVKNNTFNVNYGISFSKQLNLPGCNVSILNNNITGFSQNGGAIILGAPEQSFQVNYNQIKNFNTGIGILGFTTGGDQNCPGCGIDFITTNSLGYPVKNDQNTFTNVAIPFSLSNNNGKGNRIVGYQLNGRIVSIKMSPNNYALIRQNKIITNLIDKPIDKWEFSNYNPWKSSLTSATLNGSMLNINGLNLLAYDNQYRDYVIDFYVSDAQGSLLDYIGNYTITNAASSYNFSVPVPSGINLSTGSRLAYTITLMGNTGGTIAGTEMAKYINITATPNCCVNPQIKVYGQLGTLCVGKTVWFDLSCDLNYFSTTGTTYEWDFGDGSPIFITSTTGQSVSHVYNSASAAGYTVKVKIKQQGCPEANITYPNLVINQYCPDCCYDPIFTLLNTGTLCTKTDINFSVTCQDPSKTASKQALQGTLNSPTTTTTTNLTEVVTAAAFVNGQYAWDFGDNSPILYTNGNGSNVMNVSHQYANPGTYTVKVTIDYSACGYEGVTTVVRTMQVVVTNCNTCCTNASIILKTQGDLCIGKSLDFEALCSGGSFPAGTTFTWNFGDLTSPVTTTSPVASHVYNTLPNPAGSSYGVSVTINQPGCAVNNAYYKLSGLKICNTVCCEKPEIRFSSLSNNNCVNEKIQFAIGCNGQSPANVAVVWDFGDGNGPQTGTLSFITYAYNTPGTYTVTAIIKIPNCPDVKVTTSIKINVCNKCCEKPEIRITPGPNGNCAGEEIGFGVGCNQQSPVNATVVWDFGDGVQVTVNGPITNHVFNEPGTYTVTAIIKIPGCPDAKATFTIDVKNCSTPCTGDCISSFSPNPGEYVASIWIKESHAVAVPTYTSGIEISFLNIQGQQFGTVYTFLASTSNTMIIDGWQKAEGKFTVPATAYKMKIKLINNSDVDTYFDDIRIQPLNSELKTFVYDPVTLRLMAELDENNYATFYEYDDEGQLIRIKKETERGIKTIKESVNNTSKKIK